MVAVEELLLYFLAVPALAYLSAALLVRQSLRRTAERQVGFLRRPGVLPRFLVFSVAFAVPLVFGAILLPQVLRVPDGTNEDLVVRALGGTYAVTALLAGLSQAWMVVRRGEGAIAGPEFVRVLILTMIPVGVVDNLLVAGLVLAGRAASPVGGPPLPGATAGALLQAIRFMAIGSVSSPLAAFLSNRVSSVEPGKFQFALTLSIVGAAPSFACLALALVSMGTP